MLIAKESSDPVAWVQAVYQVVNNCAIDPVDDLTSFDLEYLFVKLRAVSISNKETVSYRDPADKMLYEVEVELDRVVVEFPEVGDGVIAIGDEARMKLKWPSASAWADPAIVHAENPEDALDALVAHCVERVWVGEETFDASSSSREEVIEFLDTLDVASWRKIRDWAERVPHLSYWVEWKNSLGETRRVELRTLTDFFTFYSPGGR